MGNSRLILGINGFLMIILGISFWSFPEFFTVAMFPNIEKNNEAFNVAIALRKNMGAGCFFIGALIFWCQNSPKFVAQKLLYCSGFGFFLLVAALLEVRMSGQAQVPMLILIMFTLMALISIYVASRRYQK
tara:strand:- start:488 stop:880 length:393 start_codon:yes stop_codon:yes gene_type:complete